jgi:hypothetical protein
MPEQVSASFRDGCASQHCDEDQSKSRIRIRRQQQHQRHERRDQQVWSEPAASEDQEAT